MAKSLFFLLSCTLYHLAWSMAIYTLTPCLDGILYSLGEACATILQWSLSEYGPSNIILHMIKKEKQVQVMVVRLCDDVINLE
ncbi:hypothetical protein K7X08_026875 [Anisodus acutangulus]|uniref:Secreted protein n=1 Tax=Anisodus acutangulus TaxID=402998 RepID=A0A9Q1LBQ9_9SOLA|nr:hypothetical protein K7X08_026875 [Anisodus acutangulus]